MLDAVNERILAELRIGGRMSMSALAERVGLTSASVYARVSGMVDSGVITGFSAQVDPRRTGLGICSPVFVTVRPQ